MGLVWSLETSTFVPGDHLTMQYSKCWNIWASFWLCQRQLTMEEETLTKLGLEILKSMIINCIVPTTHVRTMMLYSLHFMILQLKKVNKYLSFHLTTISIGVDTTEVPNRRLQRIQRHKKTPRQMQTKKSISTKVLL